MDAARHTDNKQETKGGPLPGLLRPPVVFLSAILLGIALNRAWAIHLTPSSLGLLGPIVTFCAVLLFLLSFREFRAAGTPVRGSERSTTIVRTGPYRVSRNPIYLSFILLVVGLSLWLNNLWLLVTLEPVFELQGQRPPLVVRAKSSRAASPGQRCPVMVTAQDAWAKCLPPLFRGGCGPSSLATLQ